MSLLKRFVLKVIVLLVASGPLAGQVSLIPTAVYISDETGIASLEVRNPTDQRQEVSISFAFAYLGSDASGTLEMKEDSGVIARRHDISTQVRVFPRAFLLAPRGKQTVRFHVLPGQDRPDRMYWTRVVITSGIASGDPEPVDADSGIGTRVSFLFRQNIPLFYCKGEVTTGLQIDDVEIIPEARKLVAVARLQSKGNAPFNGSVTVRLRYADGRVVAGQRTSSVIYFNTVRRMELPLPEEALPPGSYTVELLFETRRRDVLPSDLVQAEPVRHLTTLQIE